MRKLKYSFGGKVRQCLPMDNSLDKNSNSVTYTNDLYRSIRPLLNFGRAIGVLPVELRKANEDEIFTFRRFSIRNVISMLIILSMVFCLGVSVVCLFSSGSKNVKEFSQAANPVLYYFIGLFSHAYFFQRKGQLRSVLLKWRGVKVSYNNEDTKLRRDVWWIFGLILTSAILENILQQSMQLTLLDWADAKLNNKTLENFDPLRSYFNGTAHPAWSALFPYHEVLFVLIFMWNKFALYAWNFMDIFLVIVSRALYFQFRAIEMHVKGNVLKFEGSSNLQDEDETERFNKWQTLAVDFEALISLLNEVKDFLSPMIFTSFAVNLFFVIVHLHAGLDPATPNSESTADDVYKTWSFLHILFRLYCMTLFASRIHDSTDEFIQLFRKCPLDCYSLRVERVERTTISAKLGLTGLNCFVVTKPFMLSLVSVVLTFEIVLLQASGTSFT